MRLSRALTLRGPTVADDPSSDSDRELAMRRADLEREFDGKMRELKAQEKRRLDRLKEEQAEFEEHRRAKTKEMADREERLKNQERKAMEATLRVQTVRSEVDSRKQRLAEVDEAERQAAAAVADAGARVEAVALRLADVRRLLAWLAIGLGLGGLAFFVASAQSGERALLVPAFAFALAALVAGAIRARARPTGSAPPPTG